MIEFLEELQLADTQRKAEAVKEVQALAELVAEGSKPGAALILAALKLADWTLPQFTAEVERLKTRVELRKELEEGSAALDEIPAIQEKINTAHAAFVKVEEEYRALVNPLHHEIQARNARGMRRHDILPKLTETAGPAAKAVALEIGQNIRRLNAEVREMKDRLETRNLFVRNSDQTKNRDEEPWKSQRAAWVADSLVLNDELTSKRAELDSETERLKTVEDSFLMAVSW